ncbi:MAG: ABC transporter ATP-binding protein [Magnetococcales bacterium]|nr:ABC transporter ATP-binding protein [Magnetococcales bacterium]
MRISSPLLSLSDIHLILPGQKTALFDGLSLSVEPGERLAVFGAEGVGKSTLLRLMAGLRLPDSGRILFQGQSLDGPPAQPGGIGVLFQNPADHFLMPLVHEEIVLGLTTSVAEKTARVLEVLELCGLPAQAADWSMSRLSGSQQSRVSLAALLASQPALVLLDEPGAALDRSGEEEMACVLERLCSRNKLAQVIFSNRQQRAERFADRILHLDRGILSAYIGVPLPNGGR